ncbi:hypothetical protein [Ruminiclostridium cellulolyticum]|uniref:Uncharacterized protein n=1 Tax=Ruminiclostridium cellulolyticum (strain ATCC 35319 / DSM 5812 / JCM 6584 / H10) TaxID=394503 RepID=B8I104_RUMCH|nr:hypothetical protein [Ruminiclostridium cellulolyticum]ACL77560.1 hypothetical protein Ccel_3271 [Ruminiclostridium cellulolyticum H10]
MREFLLNNLVTIIILIACIIYIAYLIVKQRWRKLREIAYKLIRQAETTITGTKKGRERFEQVMTQLYMIIPPWLRLFITQSLLEKKLQEWFDKIKDSLDDGIVNNSIKPPGMK